MPADPPTSSSQVLTRVDGLVPTAPARADSGAGEVPTGKIGRFVVLRKLGEGGMGIVYAAYDEELERKVAIKLLRGEFHGQKQSVGQARLLREAQSMARLSHPHIVQVYEVGQFEGAVFIAMEFVSGGSMKEWLLREDPPWRPVLAAYVQAGQGLAAAHRAGIVHRDFKPDNVLVGDDQRVRVADFGLARHDEEADAAVSARAPVSSSSELTQAGTFIGTPAYMAPEQLLREPADALSDQFSFCVALFEGLYGYRPFKGSNTAEITRSVLDGKPREPPRDTAVPGWVHAALLRGLSRDPAQRFPGIDELLAVLSADPDRARRRRLALGGGALAVLLVAGGGGYAVHELRAQDAARCVGARDQLAGVWDGAAADAVRRALGGTRVAYAGEVADRVERQLADYADGWVAMRGDACEAHQRGEQSDSLYDLRVACLDDRKTALAALVGVLQGADAAILERAVQAVEQLPALARCADTRALLAQIPPPEDPAAARAVEGLRARLAGAQATFDVGQYRATGAAIEPLVGEAEALAHAPTLAAVLHLAGRVDDALGEYPGAEATLLRAAATADGGGDDEVRAAATIDLVRVVGVRQARFDEGLRLAALARGAAERLPAGDAEEALLEGRVGDLYLARGDLDSAEPHIDRALAVRARVHGETSTPYAQALLARGVLRYFRGDFEAALADYGRVVGLYERIYGENHPQLGDVLTNIGAIQATLFRHADARATFTRALAIFRGAYGESHPSLATVYANLGMSAQLEAEFPEARASFERALAIYEAHLPPDHPSRGDCFFDLGNTHLFAGDPAAAAEAFGRALAVYADGLGPGHVKATQARIHLGMARLRGGDPAAAEAELRRALAEFTGEADDPALGAAHAGLGQVYLAQGRPAEAAAALERALELLTKNLAVAAPYEVAEARFALARVLAAMGPGQAGRARQLAEEARADFARVGATFRGAAAEVDAWLTASAAAG